MRPIRLIVLTSLTLTAAALAVAAALPSHYEVSRSTVIHADAATLASRLADLSSREAWVPWKQTEPTARFVAAGEPGTPGSTFSWDGAKIGAGTVTLLAVSGTREITTRVEIRKPMTVTSRDRFLLTPLADGRTQVTWSNDGTLAYPIGRLLGLGMDRLIGGDYAQGLENFRRLVEAPAVATR